jgi:hypothetical protein
MQVINQVFTPTDRTGTAEADGTGEKTADMH